MGRRVSHPASAPAPVLTFRELPQPNSSSCCLKPGLGLAMGRVDLMASSTSLQPSPVTVITYAVTMVVLREMPAKLGHPHPQALSKTQSPLCPPEPRPHFSSPPPLPPPKHQPQETCQDLSSHIQAFAHSVPSAWRIPQAFSYIEVLSETNTC